MITVADPHRAGHELLYYPGEVNMRMADVVIINKVDSAAPENIEQVRNNTRRVNPAAVIIDAASPIKVENPEIIKGKKVLIVEDGPTLTHGDMAMGAGTLAAQKYGAGEIVDPRQSAVRSLAETYKLYPPHVGAVVPAMGYGAKQIADLEATIAAIDCEAVIVGTPIDLARVIKIDKPSVRVRYELQEIGTPNLEEVLRAFVKEHKLG